MLQIIFFWLNFNWKIYFSKIAAAAAAPVFYIHSSGNKLEVNNTVRPLFIYHTV